MHQGLAVTPTVACGWDVRGWGRIFSGIALEWMALMSQVVEFSCMELSGVSDGMCGPNRRVGTRDPFIEAQPVGNLQFTSVQRASPTTPRHFLASIVRELVRRMHEEENSSTRCLIKHQNEFRRNRVRLW